jgi:hypothetical protein
LKLDEFLREQKYTLPKLPAWHETLIKRCNGPTLSSKKFPSGTRRDSATTKVQTSMEPIEKFDSFDFERILAAIWE